MLKVYKTVILPIGVYRCETWSLTLREGQRPRVFENRVLRRIFGAKRNEVTGEWKKLHNEKLYNLFLPMYHLADLVKEDEVSWICGMHGREETCVQGFCSKARRKVTTRKTEA
jgi:hypothetical protein